MINGLSRRAFLGVLPLGLAAQTKQLSKKSKPLPSAGEFVRFTDPLTENPIVRLTSLNSTNRLPAPRNRFLSTRERILLFASNRTGHFAPFQMDLRTGAVRQFADAAKLDPQSLCLDRSEKTCRYLDGDSLIEAPLEKGAPRSLATAVDAFASSLDGSLFVVSRRKLSKLGGPILAEDVTDLFPQPNAAGCLFSCDTNPGERALYYVRADSSSKPVLLAEGRIRQPFWDRDGESILFLRDVAAPDGTPLSEIHGRHIAGGDEYLVSATTQFASFSPNSDASVFVGASRSKAQPALILMLRDPRRELMLCEHRDSNPAEVAPVFSPDNRRIYFQSDREGHLAIYSVNVEKLVEPASP